MNEAKIAVKPEKLCVGKNRTQIYPNFHPQYNGFCK